MKSKQHLIGLLCKNPVQQGASLVIVLIILTVVSLLGVAGIQISMMSERGARNDRDQQIAWQSAEAALVDAEIDIFSNTSVNSRQIIFTPLTNVSAFIKDCGTSGNSIGLCKLSETVKPVWQTVNFETTGATARTTAYGTFTGRSFTAGRSGVQPAALPRYIIEAIRDPGDLNMGLTEPQYVYRVTAMGFGPRLEIQAVVQMIYRN